MDKKSRYNKIYYGIYSAEESQKVRLHNELRRNHHPNLPPLNEFIIMPYDEIYKRFDFLKKYPQNSPAYDPREAIKEKYGINKRKRIRELKGNKTNSLIFGQSRGEKKDKLPKNKLKRKKKKARKKLYW